MRLSRTLVPIASAFVLATAVASPAQAATVANWAMSEGSGARTMGGSPGPSGSIGGKVQTGVTVAGTRGYRFPGGGGVDRGRIVTVGDRASLDPGRGRYVVSVRFLANTTGGNIVQKGQSNTPGGFLKIELHSGSVSCTYKGSAGSVGIGRPAPTGRWHTVRCERNNAGVSIKVDGGPTVTSRRATGNIANNQPLSIGGKTSCNGGSVGCDYFNGAMDYVRIER